MKKILLSVLLLPCFAVASEIDGIGFIKIGQSKTAVLQEMKAKRATFLATSNDEVPHPSAQAFKYENVQLTPVFKLPTVELFFHKNKLYQIYAENYPNPYSNNPAELANFYAQTFQFDNVIQGLKEKYTFVLDKKEEKLEKGDSEGCPMDLLVQQMTWKIPTKQGLTAEYFEQKVLNPVTKVELGNADIDGDACYHFPFNALIVRDTAVSEETQKLQEESIKQQEMENQRERQKELEGL